LAAGVSERRITIDEVVELARSGELTEVFGSGTAAVISPVGVLSHQGQDVVIHKGQTGELSRKLYDHIARLQRGLEEDKFGWVERIDHLKPEVIARGEE